jgi:hypothetical protein
MRNPARKALYALFALAVSAALIRFGIGRHETVGPGWGSDGPTLLGLAALPFCLVTFIQALFAVRGRARLLAGIGVIGRWQAYPGEWEQFRKLDSRRAGKAFALGNDLWVRRAAPTGPVEVIVGEKSALVNGSYHSLKPGGIPDLRGVRWLEGPPTCLEFALRYPRGRYGGTVPMTFRIPVPAGARGQAALVFDHYDRLTRPGPGISNRALGWVYGVCASLILGTLLASAVIYLFAPSWREGSGEFVLIGLLIGSSILALFAAVLFVATLLLDRRA